MELSSPGSGNEEEPELPTTPNLPAAPSGSEFPPAAEHPLPALPDTLDDPPLPTTDPTGPSSLQESPPAASLVPAEEPLLPTPTPHRPPVQDQDPDESGGRVEEVSPRGIEPPVAGSSGDRVVNDILMDFVDARPGNDPSPPPDARGAELAAEELERPPEAADPGGDDRGVLGSEGVPSHSDAAGQPIDAGAEGEILESPLATRFIAAYTRIEQLVTEARRLDQNSVVVEPPLGPDGTSSGLMSEEATVGASCFDSHGVTHARISYTVTGVYTDGSEIGSVTQIVVGNGRMRVNAYFFVDGVIDGWVRVSNSHDESRITEAISYVEAVVGIVASSSEDTEAEQSLADDVPDAVAEATYSDQQQVVGQADLELGSPASEDLLDEKQEAYILHREDIAQRLADLGDLQDAAFRRAYADLIRTYAVTNNDPASNRSGLLVTPMELAHLKRLTREKFPDTAPGEASGGRPLTQLTALKEMIVMSDAYGVDVLNMSREEFYAFCLEIAHGEVAVSAEICGDAPFVILDREFTPAERFPVYIDAADRWIWRGWDRRVLMDNDPTMTSESQARRNQKLMGTQVAIHLGVVSQTIPDARALLYELTLEAVLDKDPGDGSMTHLGSMADELCRVLDQHLMSIAFWDDNLGEWLGIVDPSGLDFYIGKVEQLYQNEQGLRQIGDTALADQIHRLLLRIHQFNRLPIYAEEDNTGG